MSNGVQLFSQKNWPIDRRPDPLVPSRIARVPVVWVLVPPWRFSGCKWVYFALFHLCRINASGKATSRWGPATDTIRSQSEGFGIENSGCVPIRSTRLGDSSIHLCKGLTRGDRRCVGQVQTVMPSWQGFYHRASPETFLFVIKSTSRTFSNLTGTKNTIPRNKHIFNDKNHTLYTLLRTYTKYCICNTTRAFPA